MSLNYNYLVIQFDLIILVMPCFYHEIGYFIVRLDWNDFLNNTAEPQTPNTQL